MSKRLRKYLVDELGISQAVGAKDDEVAEIAVKTMKAMHQAYVVVTDALNVATGNTEALSSGVQPIRPGTKGFTVEDNR